MGEKLRIYADVITQSSEVTGSCFLLVIRLPGENKPIKGIIDCGIFQEKPYETCNQEFTFNARELDFALLTHVHMDHVGRVPKLFKEGYQGYVYCTKDTSTLLEEQLKNGLKVMKRNAKVRHKPELVLYQDQDIDETIKHIRDVEYCKTYQVHENVLVTFYRNYHLIGSSMILVDIYDYDNHCIKLLFTGDYNTKNIFMDKFETPSELFETPLTIFTESTYGSSMSWEEEEPEFKKNLKDAMEKRKIVVIPAFALGRSQEVLYTLKTMQNEGTIPENVNIFLDGNLAIKYTDLYRNGFLELKESMKDFLPKNFSYVDGECMRESLISDDECKIIVTTAGMGRHGPAQVYIQNLIERENALIHFTGYCAEGTFGRILKEAEPLDEIDLGGLLVQKKADVKYTSEFSSHARADEIIDFLSQFENPLSIIVNHGEKEKKNDLARNIKMNIKAKKVGVIDQETVFRISEYGISKTMQFFNAKD